MMCQVLCEHPHALLRPPFDRHDPEVHKACRAWPCRHGTRPRRQTAPLVTADILSLAGGYGGTLRGDRGRVLILFGFAGALRRAELVAVHVVEFHFGPRGLSVVLPRSKADQDGEDSLVHIAASALAAHCSVMAGRSWLAVSGTTAGRVCRRISRDDAIRPRGPVDRKFASNPEESRLGGRLAGR